MKIHLIWLITNGILIASLLKSICERSSSVQIQFVNLFAYNVVFILILAYNR